jgi:hypothetical protein
MVVARSVVRIPQIVDDVSGQRGKKFQTRRRHHRRRHLRHRPQWVLEHQ